MGVPRSAVLASTLLIVSLGLAGCGSDSSDEPKEARATVEEAATQSRERVQAYLDAMKVKDLAAGRSQMCATAQKAFDASASGPTGDFAKHFTVTGAEITEVRDTPRGQEVNAAVTVQVPRGAAQRAALLFTVTRNGTEWCISGETTGSLPASSPAANPSS